MAPKRKHASQVVDMSKRMRKSAQGYQQVTPEHPILQVVEDLCGHLGRLDECVRADETLGSSDFQEQLPGDAGSGGKNSDPVMLLLQCLSSC